MLLDGLHIPLTTPFYPDGRVYLRKLEHNADRYSRTPAAGLIVLSSLGEAGMLSSDEAREALSVAAAASAKEKVLIAGVGCASVYEAVRLAAHAGAAGYDAVLLRAQGAWPGRRVGRGDVPAEVAAFFRAVADQSPLPVILENAPAETGYDLPVETIAALARHPNILGLSEASTQAGKMDAVRKATAEIQRTATVTTVFTAATRRMLAPATEEGMGSTFVSADSLTGSATALAAAPPKPALRTRTKEVGFQVMAAGAANYFSGLAASAVLSLAACAPQACHEVLAAWKDGDEALAREKYERIRVAAQRMEELGVGAVKFACDLNGYFGGRPRLPLLPPAGTEQAEIIELLRGMPN
jgi:4-hydroxy-2-oxoglutarate aldolase